MNKLKENISSWMGIFVGCSIMAIGFVFFINPYNFVPGGVYGASIVMHNLFPSIQVGTFGYMFDIPLLILSLVLLGAKLGARTIVASLFTPFVMNVLSELVYPTQEALQSLDPSLMLGGMLDLSDHLMLACLMGSVLIGVGCGIVVKSQATTGGTDIVAMILQKYANIRFSNGILIVDALVVAFGLLVIGFGIGTADDSTQPSWHLSFYSLIAIYVISRVLAYVINGAKDDKLVFVIGSGDMTELNRFILEDLDRSATYIKSRGLYSNKEKEMLFLVVRNKEVNSVKHKIKEVDPRAFVVVTDAYDTFGEGWKPLPSKGEIQPE
jgi:uncharacterized membrane-anchored protein YitT (DUF2179 family)